MKHKTPLVSVVMPVYNREKYVNDAVNSILNQTFSDFEFIIIDDSSTDSTYEILQSFNDDRMKIVKKEKNMGNYNARNEGMELAKGMYICVMDSDDIALQNRIHTQFDFMEKNKHFGLCGSYVKIMNSNEIITAPEDYNEIKVWSLSNIMCRHPTVFIRTEFLKRYKLKYNETYHYAGDYDFLVRAAQLFPVTNIQEVLLEYRKHPEQISIAFKSEQIKIVQQVIVSQLENFKKHTTDNEKQLHLSLMNRDSIKSEADFNNLRTWANFLLQINYTTRIYDSIHLANFLKCLLKYILKNYQISQVNNEKQKLHSIEINNFLNSKINFPLQNPWVVLPDFIKYFVELVKISSISDIVECGSGISTIIGGYLVKKKIIKHYISIEHDKNFLDITKEDLKKHGLENLVTLIYAPLKKINIDEKEWLWYDMALIYSKINRIDVLLVDGPPGHIQKNSRFPASIMLKKFFHNNTIIVMDDSNRDDEQEIINQWLIENPDYEVDYYDTLKGMAVITRSRA